MKRIKVANGIWAIFIDRSGDPPCTITRDSLEGFSLFFCEYLKELIEHLFAMTFCHPNHYVCRMVDDDGDVVMAFCVACFIDTDIFQVFQAF